MCVLCPFDILPRLYLDWKRWFGLEPRSEFIKIMLNSVLNFNSEIPSQESDKESHKFYTCVDIL